MFKRSILLSTSIGALTLGLVGTAQMAVAADPAAGKVLTQQQQCSDCHEPEDWKGNSEAQLQAKLKLVVAGKVSHKKKVQLTDTQIADIAAYWANGAAQ